ncbi:OTU-domain-containing protein [Durotheca rogersii]|uniref:OTU-domain-containing protein n=1 Tax=Durotheca rogersii TaxID=419775 RepID=UPI0022212012|nr:OTU-domain-containing protein [Durotheca rogersii]KAI5860265.1 OTU-domain-containing protein [Durotheca rogersii]
MESLEAMQARHRKEQRDLQGRITSRKKNATKKTRKAVGDECAELERRLREKQAQELAALEGGAEGAQDAPAGAAQPREDGSRDRDRAGGAAGADADAADGIAEQLRDATLAPASPETRRPPPPPPPPQQQPAPKKRNRQKERMARRAAEQEAAAAAAEREAAGMADQRGLEKTALLRAFAAHGLVEREMRPDGHCLFSAVADQLQTRGVSLAPRPPPAAGGGGGGEEEEEEEEEEGEDELPPYQRVRRAAADYMRAHADAFAPFLDEPLPAYAARVRDTAEWGGQLELAALASAYGVAIRVLQDGRTETVEPAGGGGGSGGGGRDRTTIWLAYYRHGYGLGEHYNSLRPAERAPE